jgi:prevent-host-death family protein
MTNMVNEPEEIGVAEAKARLSELLMRVVRGERFVVARRGTPLAALISADQMPPPGSTGVGLAAVAGALADEDDLVELIDQIYGARRRARDRDVPELG